MNKIISLSEAIARPESLISNLTVRSMKYNYPDFVKEYGHDRANEAMERVYGNQWHDNKEEVWFWFDNEFYRDSEGNVHV